jgi:hypothetical protein
LDRSPHARSCRTLAEGHGAALFDDRAVMAYFRSSDDERAAKRLANQASPEFLTEILSELSDRCEQGWVVSKAAMRAQTVGDVVWPIIRSKHPATYLYLCARRRRGISEAEGLELVLTCPNSIMNETRGLAIWAVGQMQMTGVLDEIVARGEELQKNDRKAFNDFAGLN